MTIVLTLAQVIAKYTQGSNSIQGMARGTLVLDENSRDLEDPLRDLNIKIVQVEPGDEDSLIMQKYLPHRIFVTRNSRDFVEGAVIHEYGIIALDVLPTGALGAIKVAQIIHKVLVKYKLWKKLKPWILVIDPRGKHRFKKLSG
jgi:hypothetical protein